MFVWIELHKGIGGCVPDSIGKVHISAESVCYKFCHWRYFTEGQWKGIPTPESLNIDNNLCNPNTYEKVCIEKRAVVDWLNGR